MGWDRMVLDWMVWDRRDVKWSGVSTRRLNAWLDLVLLLLITILVAIMLAQWDMLGLATVAERKGPVMMARIKCVLFEDFTMTGWDRKKRCH